MEKRADLLREYLHNILSLKNLCKFGGMTNPCEYGGLTRAEAYFDALKKHTSEELAMEEAEDV